jgi:tetratricopeptide (TPR) repeat protein
MTASNRALFQRHGSDRHFLFTKTDTGLLKDVGHKEFDGAVDALQSVYPAILSGREFIDRSQRELESSIQFAAMVIRLDQTGQGDESPAITASNDGLLEAALILDTVCREEKAMWGVYESGLLSGVFPAKDGLQTIDLAAKIQNRLKKKTQKTITIGVAAYPTITYQKSDILANARKALDHATFFGPDSAVVFDGVSLNISSDKLYENGDIQGAIEELKKALLLDPSNVNVHNSLGVCFGLLGNYEPALEEFKTAVALEPEEYMALYNMGLVYMLTDRRERALELFLRADKINGSAFEVTFQTGKLYLELGEPEKSRIFLERAAAIEPISGAVYRYLGECYAANNLQQEAISAYRKAVKLNPQDAASMSALGCLFADQGENPEITLMFCRESVGLVPDNGLFRYRLGRLYADQNRFEDALREFQKAQELGYDVADDIEKIQKNLAPN